MGHWSNVQSGSIYDKRMCVCMSETEIVNAVLRYTRGEYEASMSVCIRNCDRLLRVRVLSSRARGEYTVYTSLSETEIMHCLGLQEEGSTTR